MVKRLRTKKFGIYEPYTMCVLPIYLTLFYTLIIALSGFFIWKFLVVQYDPGVFLLLIILWAPVAFATIGLFQNGLIKRLLVRFTISRTGVCCSGCGIRKHIITWGRIRTFGIIGYSVSYVPRTLILFSTDPQERAPKNLTEANRVSESRIVIQYRKDVWAELLQNMPEDMGTKLSYALSKKQDCFHKR